MRGALVKAVEAVSEQDPVDIVVPISRTADFIRFINDLEARSGMQMVSFGHAGDGNLHIYCCSNDLAEDEFKARAEKFMEAVYIKATELGGQVSGEHGIGNGRLEFLE